MRKAVQSSAPPAMASAPAEGRRRSGGRRGEEPTPCCSKVGLKRGPWAPEEDELLASYVRREGEGRWRTLPKRAGLQRCGKSCRLRWMNYLRPSIKRGPIAPDEEDLILRLHSLLGNRWSLIAGRIPGRTDNEIKNYWNTHLSKKLIGQGIDPRTHKPFAPSSPLVPLGFEIKLPPQPTPTAPYRTTLSPDSGTTFDDAQDNVSSNATPVRSDHFGRFSGGGFNNDEELEFGTTAGDQGAFEGSGGGGGVAVKGSGADEALKSFVDSLINEDFFLQQQNAANRCDHDHNNNYVDVDGAVLGRGGLLEGELASLAELE